MGAAQAILMPSYRRLTANHILQNATSAVSNTNEYPLNILNAVKYLIVDGTLLPQSFDVENLIKKAVTDYLKLLVVPLAIHIFEKARFYGEHLRDVVAMFLIEAYPFLESEQQSLVATHVQRIIQNHEFYKPIMRQKAALHIINERDKWLLNAGVMQAACCQLILGVGLENEDAEFIHLTQSYSYKKAYSIASNWTVINHAYFEEQGIVKQAIHHIARDLSAYPDEVRNKVKKLSRQMKAALCIRPTTIHALTVEGLSKDDKILKVIDHMAKHLEDYSVATIEKTMAQDTKNRIVAQVKKIISASVSSTNKKIVLVASACVINNHPRFTEFEYNKAKMNMAALIDFFRNRGDRAVGSERSLMNNALNGDEEVVQDAASLIIEKFSEFPTKKIEQAIDYIADHLDNFSPEIITKAAQLFVNRHRSFFEAPLNGMDNSVKFRSFYKNLRKESVIKSYSDSLSMILQLPRPKKTMSPLSLWNHGNFDAALNDVRVAKSVLAMRKDEAIQLWNLYPLQHG